MLSAYRIFNLTGLKVNVREDVAFKGHSLIHLSEIAAEDHDFAIKALESLGYSLTSTPQETASFGILEFSNDKDLTIPSKDDEDANENSESDDEDTNDGIELSADDVSTGLGGGGSSKHPRLNGGDGKFKVLVDTQQHKLASKTWTDVLGNTDDMTDYGSFLYDYDTFLSTYLNKEVENDDGDMVPNPKRINDIKPQESASADVPAGQYLVNLFAEMAEDGVASAYAELAKKGKKKEGKKGRSGFLSKLMKAMSGSNGEKAVSAWESGDKAAMKLAMDAVAADIAETMEDEKPEEDDAASEDDGGNTAVKPSSEVQNVEKKQKSATVEDDLGEM